MRSIFFVFTIILAQTYGVKKVAEVEGDVYIAVLLTNCQNSSEYIPFRIQSMISSTLWTAHRINYLELLFPLKVGVEIYEICNETDYFQTIFQLYQQNQEYFVGLISSENFNEKVKKFCEVLDTTAYQTSKYESFLVKASIQFLGALGWVDNISVFAPQEHVLNEFFGYSKKEFICVKNCMVYR